MKKLLFVTLLLALFACNKEPGYKISVKLNGAAGTLVLQKHQEGEYIDVNTAELKNGEAVLKGSVDFPDMYYLSIKGGNDGLAFFIENSNISITGKADSISMAKVTGSKTQDEYTSLVSEIQSVSKEYNALYQQAKQLFAQNQTKEADSIMVKVNALYSSTDTIEDNFIKSHPASFASPYILANIQYDMDETQLESYLNAMDTSLNVSPVVQMLRERVAKLKTVAVGKTAPDFTENDPDGNPVKFSDVYSKNKYTLVDFWAGWCNPCRQENPNVVAIYKDYKSKGFSVLGVSLDRTKDQWVNAIKEDGLTWQHVSDLSYWNSAAAQLYAINSIPANLLVDNQGTIIAKNLKGDDLRKKISDLLDH